MYIWLKCCMTLKDIENVLGVRQPLHKHCYISKSIVVNALSASSVRMTQRNYLYDK